MKKVFLKYIVFSSLVVVFSTLSSLPTFAQVAAVKKPNSTPTITGNKKVVIDEANTTDSEKVDNLKARALQEIDRRIKEFTLLQEKIPTLNHLTEKNKSALLTQITSELTSLNTTKSTITSETSLTALKKEVQVLISSYNVFAVYVPKIHILIASDMIDETADKIASVSGLETGTTDASSSASDNSQKSALDQIALAHSNAASARTMALSVTSINLTTGRLTLQKARTLLVVARQNLAEVRQDIAKTSEPTK